MPWRSRNVGASQAPATIQPPAPLARAEALCWVPAGFLALHPGTVYRKGCPQEALGSLGVWALIGAFCLTIYQTKTLWAQSTAPRDVVSRTCHLGFSLCGGSGGEEGKNENKFLPRALFHLENLSSGCRRQSGQSSPAHLPTPAECGRSVRLDARCV